MARTLSHVTCHGEWWDPDDGWQVTVTLHHPDGTYAVLPPVEVGPFDTFSDALDGVVREWQGRLV